MCLKLLTHYCFICADGTSTAGAINEMKRKPACVQWGLRQVDESTNAHIVCANLCSGSRGAPVIIGTSGSSSGRPLVSVPAPYVPEELVSQAQVVLQGKSRNLIIRELQVCNNFIVTIIADLIRPKLFYFTSCYSEIYLKLTSKCMFV